MSIFGKFRSSPASSTFTLQEAACGILLSVIGSDGHISDEEASAFSYIANRHILFREQSASDFNRMLDKMQSYLKREDWRAVIEKCSKDLPPEFGQTVFSLAVDFVFADGAVERDEMEVVEYLQGSLKVSREFAGMAVSVLSAKNAVF